MVKRLIVPLAGFVNPSYFADPAVAAKDYSISGYDVVTTGSEIYFNAQGYVAH